MEFSYIVSVINSLLGVLFLALTYTYLDKLEKTGCQCAEHPYRKYVKNFTTVAIVYLVLTMFVPPEKMVTMFGPVFSYAFAVLHYLFAVAAIIFFVLAIIYVRYLMREKCKCSEDIRREILYFVSILEILFLFTAVIFAILTGVTSSALVLALNTVNGSRKYENTVVDAVRNPLNAARKLPESVKKLPKTFKKNFNLKARK